LKENLQTFHTSFTCRFLLNAQRYSCFFFIKWCFKVYIFVREIAILAKSSAKYTFFYKLERKSSDFLYFYVQIPPQYSEIFSISFPPLIHGDRKEMGYYWPG
jgi:hypothetical protein